jgi:hypothetical protein
MALITSAASGNFSAGATWTGGVVPGVGDEARASTGHTITIDVNTTCDEVSNAGTGIFTLNDGITLTANVTNKSATTARTCLQFTAASPAQGFIVGNCTGGTSIDGVAVANLNTGSVTITGNLIGGIARAYGANNASTGSVTVTGSVTGGSGTTLPGGLNNASTGSVTVTGSVTGGTTVQAHGVLAGSTGTVTIVGNVTAAAASGVFSTTAATILITGDVTATNSNHGVNAPNASASLKISGSFIQSANGTVPVYAQKFILDTTPSVAKTRYALNGTGTYVDMFTADNNLTQAAPADVRSGTVYADGNLTGTCAVPAAGSVALGVPVDATTGTAVLTPAAVWEYATREITGGVVDTLTNSPDVPTEAEIATAVWGASTKEITGGTVTNLTNAPASVTPADIWDYNDRTLTSASGPTAVEIRQEIDANSSKLDVAISTRLADADYVAPANSDVAAVKVVTDALVVERLNNTATTAIVGNLIAQANS